MDEATFERELAIDISKFYADPLGFVMYAFQWDTDPALQVVRLMPPYSLAYGCDYGPDLWACELLDRVGRQVREHGFDGRQPVEAIREAIVSGHGIGKSAIVAWLVLWIMSTRPHCHGTVTATTSNQLSAKTWPEIAKWTKRCVTGRWFEVTTGKGNMRLSHKRYAESWYCNAQTCNEQEAEAFAGQHAADSTSFYIFDEASGVPDAIKDVAEGGLTDGEPMMFAFGNGTQNTGWFYDCFHAQAHRWNTQHIDSREVQITNKEFLQELIDDYGLDSDFVKVRVRGMFPSLSVKQYISVADADAGFKRHLLITQYDFAPVVLTCDPAWEGDDELVIGKRQGLRYDVLKVIAKNDNDIEIAGIIARYEDDLKAEAVFIDGGFGTGIVSAGRTMARNWQIVWASAAPPDEGCFNMRAYCAKQVRDWLKAGGSYGDQKLHDELICFEAAPRMDGKLQIEAKKDIKRRLGYSPGRYDALALSFAYPVKPKAATPTLGLDRAHGGRQVEYDPFASNRLR